MPKKRQRETLEELLARPWCYYCDRDFDDGKILHDHQKAKHFHCMVDRCNRRLNTVGGLKVHMNQVHKEDLHEVPNAMEGRKDVYPEIFGMEGVPESLVAARTAVVKDEYYRMEAEHRARTGNPLPGSGTTHETLGVSKRPKVESKEDLKRRVAEAKAKRAAAKAAAAAGGTPVNAPATTESSMTPEPMASMTPEPTLNPNSYPPPTGFHMPAPQPQINSMWGLPPTPMSTMSPHGGFHSQPTAASPQNLATPMQPGSKSDPAIDAMIEEQQKLVAAQLQRSSSATDAHDAANGTSNGTANSSGPQIKPKTESQLLSDNVVSWEEKRARAARYSKAVGRAGRTVLGAPSDRVTGVVDSEMS